MVNYLFRGICLAFGLWIGADAILPAVDSAMLVGPRESVAGHGHDVRFNGTKTVTCHLDAKAYEMLEEGDKVLLGTSRAFGQCLYVERDGLTIYSKKDWRGWEAAIAFVLLAIAFGKLRGNSTNNDDSEGGGWSIFTDD